MVLLAGGVAYAAIGDLTQKAGTAGCVSDTGTSGACQDGGPLDAAAGVAVSPDGTSVYVATGGLNGDAVVIFDRNPATGTLTQKTGTAGCVSDTGTGGACQDGVALDGVSDVAVSPDGRSVYAASLGTGAVAVFNRNTSNTANRGALTQKADPNDCWSDNGVPATGGTCQNGTALVGAGSVAVSPDGTSVYVGSAFSDAVAVFDRDTTNTAARGALTQKADPNGCWSETATPPTGGTCQVGKALDSVSGVEVSPDGDSVYATADASDAIAVFDRDTTNTAARGTLTQKADPDGCVSDTGTSGACQNGVALDAASDLALSGDGASVYVAAPNSGAVAIFDRDTTSTAARGTLTQKADPNDCWSDTGTPATGGTCQNGVALNAPAGVAVSPDGTSVYAAVTFSDAVAIFDRDTSNSASSGTLTQKADPAGCVSETGTSGTCQDGEALDGAANVTVSPDGASVYVTALTSDSVAIFDRATTDAPPPSPPGGGGTGGGGGGTGGGGGDASGDAAPPDTQITDGPKDKVRTSKKRKKVTFEFTSTEAGSTFECSLDGAPFAPCTSPSVEKVKKGKHGFEVRATDPAGNVDPTPATDTWKVKRKRS